MTVKTKKQSGFGLIEVLVSIAIISVVILTLGYLYLTTSWSWENAKNKSVAYNLVQSRVEELHNLRDSNIVNGSVWDSSIVTNNGLIKNVENKDFTITTIVDEVDINNPSASKKKVTVKANWVERTGNKKLEVVTYLTNWKSAY